MNGLVDTWNYCSKSPTKDSSSVPDEVRFVRERNMLLLSALFKLYGEEWSNPPDWSAVVDEIEKAKIPYFGEGFTPESCQTQYQTLMEEGFQRGLYNRSHKETTPRLKDSEKRLYILAMTSNDLVSTSKVIENIIVDIYEQLRQELDTATDSEEDDGDLTEQSADDVESDPDMTFMLAYQDDRAKLLAGEVLGDELNEDINGMKDVLVLNKYCCDPVAYAVEKLEGIIARIQSVSGSPADVSPVKDEKLAEPMKTATSRVSEQLSNLVQEAISKAPVDERPKVSSPASTAPTLSKLLELPITNPGMPLPEITPKHSPTSSPEKQSSKNSSGDKIDDATKSDSGETTPLHSPVKSGTLDTNGQDSSSDVLSTENSPVKSEISKEKSLGVDSPSSTKTSTETVDETESEPMNPIGSVSNTDSGETDGPNNESITATQSETSEPVETTQDSPTKSKQVVKKNVSRPTRNSSRLATPEPTEKSNEEEKSPKKPPSRQSSISDGYTPSLRTRRVGTPTKAADNEQSRPSSSVETSKLDFTDENEDEAFETPRSSPESDVKSDTESVLETPKPQKPMKTYSSSSNPPSLSHVIHAAAAAEIFEQFIDDEDDPELAEIDSTANKARNDKLTSKTYSKRGRRNSSENTSDTPNNDENNTKRSSRKGGMLDDAEEDAVSNNEEGSSKRLTRSSLRAHDAANEESTDAHQTGSERAPSESSAPGSERGKERKPRSSKAMLRLKNLQEEGIRVLGDVEETPEGKRVTRARAKTTVPQQTERSRSKPPSVGDSELSESEPTPTRSTRSRSSTVSSMPVLEVTTLQQNVVGDDEEQKAFRKSALIFVEKVINSEATVQLKKYLDDPFDVLKKNIDFGTIKKNIECGEIRTAKGIYGDLSQLAMNVLMAHPNVAQARDASMAFYKYVKFSFEEFTTQQNQSSKNDSKMDSDAESVESHEEQRSESSKQGGRRKRKRSVSETSEEAIPQENKRRVTRTSASTPQQNRKPKLPVSPDIIIANRVRH